MQKSFVSSLLILAGLLAAPGLVFSQTLVIDNSTNNNPQTLNQNGGSLTVTSSGTLTVTTSSVAVTATASSTVTNSGIIQQTGSGKAIRGNAAGITFSVTNNVGAQIISTQDDAFQMNTTGNVTLYNKGTINSKNTGNASGAQGVDWNAVTSGSNTLYNYTTGLIEAGDNDAVRPGANGFVYNSGTIEATSGSGDGINTQKNSGVTIINDDVTDTGAGSAPMIIGTHHGIGGGNSAGTTSFTITITNNANGTIKGLDGSGINLDSASQDNGVTIPQTATINNQGLIQGAGITGDGDGVDVDGTVTLTNGSATNSAAKIVSLTAYNDTSEGVTVGGGTIMNYGTIQGSVETGGQSGTGAGTPNTAVGRGITLAGTDKDGSGTAIPIQGVYATTSVTNYSTGKIIGDSDAGIAIEGHLGGTSPSFAMPYVVTITNAGTIQGNATSTGNSSAAAIYADAPAGIAPNVIHIINTGTITDTFSGKAIDFGSGIGNTLAISGGTAAIVGNINGGSGSTGVTIDPGQGNTFSYAGSMSNLSSVQNESGTVTFTGASTYTGTTTISGGTTYVNNASGSGTGAGEVDVKGGATFGGSGTVTPGTINTVAKGVKLEANGTLISGVIPAAGVTTVGTGLTLDNRTAGGVILDASVGSADLTFLLGSGPKTSTSFNFDNPETNSSFLTVLGNARGELAFATGDTITLDDLTNGNLDLLTHVPYLLISTGAADNSDFTGLQTTGVSVGGNPGNGYVTNLTLQMEGAAPGTYQSLGLYLDSGKLEVVPEPSTWVLMLGGLGCLIFINARRRQRN
jgi:hypothetical protein